MEEKRMFRHVVIAVILLLGVFWALSSVAEKEDGYPNSRYLVDAGWLKTHMNDDGLVIADVRTGDHYDGQLIPGALRLPWSDFRTNDMGDGTAAVFVGVRKAQEILGNHGITAGDTVVLYDSVARDGGATASYVFWILDILGHESKMILERGIDGWADAGFDRVTEPQETRPLFYQAVAGKINRDQLIDGDFVYNRLGDPFYQIIDVRSQEEYRGEKGTRGLDGTPLKLGHIPTAVNINYQDAWIDKTSKAIKSYAELQELYRGIDPARGVIVYCNSGRRSSFSYFILRLMGFETVYTYEASWKEWGSHENFYPVETRANVVAGKALPQASPGMAQKTSGNATDRPSGSSSQTKDNGPAGGYVSCGG